jgi:ABC-type Fe3+-hydroxamate transport system substrate-binding protein
MMKKLLLALLLCTSGANAAVVVTHAYGYGVARPVVVAPRPVIVAPRPVVVVPRPVVVTPVPVVVSAAPVVATPVAHPVAAAVGAVGAGVYRHNERQDAYDEINHLQDQRINAYNQHHH